MTEPIRVLIVEDHRAVAELLEIGLSRHEGVRVIGTAFDAATAERLATELRPDVVLMDQHLPGSTGSALAARMRLANPRLAVVMLSGDASDDAMLSAIEAGASGYLLKAGPASEILHAVRKAASGEITIPAETLSRLFALRRRREQELGEQPSLTPREREVLTLMAEGLDNKTAAVRLGLSLHTVRNHVEHVLAKLDSHSKLEAVARAHQRGLIKDRRRTSRD